MLLAILYCEPDQIAAAAMACEQTPLGDSYWSDQFVGDLATGSIFETAYINVQDHQLCFKLLNLGIDSAYDGRELAKQLETIAVPNYESRKRAA